MRVSSLVQVSVVCACLYWCVCVCMNVCVCVCMCVLGISHGG